MEPKFVEANGLKFGYLEQGQGPMVILVHGFPDTAYTWDRTLPVLADAGFRAVAPFTRAYFPTQIPPGEDYKADALAADVVALIEKLSPDGTAIVVGHDFGASAAYGAAAIAPDRVKKLVTLAIPHPRSITPTPWMIWKVRHFFTLSRKKAPAKMRAGDFAEVDRLVHRWSPAWDVPADETTRVKDVFRRDGVIEAVLGYYRALKPPTPECFRRTISVPSTAFAGETDIVAVKAYEKARRCFSGPYAVVSMPGGHFMHREHPEHFHRELLRVLKS